MLDIMISKDSMDLRHGPCSVSSSQALGHRIKNSTQLTWQHCLCVYSPGFFAPVANVFPLSLLSDKYIPSAYPQAIDS